MKKSILLCLVLPISLHLFAQKSFVKFQVGYAFPIVNERLTTNTSQTFSASSSASTTSGIYGSYGNGVQFEVGYEYEFSEKLSFQLDALYLLGNDVKSNLFFSNNGANFSQNQSINSRFYEIAPLVKFNLLSDKSVSPYVVIGPTVGFGNFSNSVTTPGSIPSQNEEYLRSYSGPLAIGAKSGLGVKFTKGTIGLYAQVTLISLSFSPSSSEITRYSVGGVDNLKNLTVRQKQTVYKENTSSSNPDTTKPFEALKFYFPLSSVSFNIGFIVRL
jgi:Outer membrane protein beta-barrel domain